MRNQQEADVEYLDYIRPAWSRRNQSDPNHPQSLDKPPRTQAKGCEQSQNQHQVALSDRTKSNQGKGTSFPVSIPQGKTIQQLADMIQQQERAKEQKLKLQLLQHQCEQVQGQAKAQINNNHNPQEKGRNQEHQKLQKQEFTAHNQMKIQQNASNSNTEHQHNPTNRSQPEKDSRPQNNSKISCPNVEVTYFNCRINLSLQSIHESTADILFIPFETHHLEYYPGSIFKPILQSQCLKLQKQTMFEGSIYLKSNHQLKNFKYLVFIKVKKGRLASNFPLGLTSLLQKVAKDKLPVQKMLFCLDHKSFTLSQLIDGLLLCKQLKKQQSLEFSISGVQGCDFKEMCREFEQKLLAEQVDI